MVDDQPIKRHPNVKDMTGQTFRRLRMVRFTRTDSRGNAFWLVLCDPKLGGCGREVEVRGAGVRNGTTKSCGCLNRDSAASRCKTHGLSATTTYRSWQAMKARCTNPKRKYWRWYGGAGVKVCERWRSSFEAFYEDMGPRPEGHTIERVNGNAHYSCGKCEECLANGWAANCVWATRKKQQNNLRTNRVIEHNGVSMTLAQWAQQAGLQWHLLYQRLKLGWTMADALGVPVGSRPSKPPPSKPKVMLEYCGRKQSVVAWASECGMTSNKLRKRLYTGWSVERALSTP